VFLISYEKWVLKTSEGVDELAKFLLLAPPANSLRHSLLEYLKGGSYKAFEDYFESQGAD
jgi:hypothetical protein